MSTGQKTEPSKMKGMLNDVTRCIGCERCVEACVRANKLPRDFLAYYKGQDGLSGNRFTAIVKTRDPKSGQWQMVRRHCMHCLEPSCAAACLVGAFHKSEDGAVVYDADKCIGCRYCMLACPFSIPRYQYDKPIPYVRKCKMNEECRVKGGMPACVAACPTHATIFGNREELIKVAQKRIEANPEKYLNHIYGQYEFGGTSVIYLAGAPVGKVLNIPTREEFEKLRLPQLATRSIPELVEPWVWVTPFQFFVVSTGLAAIWFLRRRSLLMNPPDTEDFPPDGDETEGKDGKE